MIIIGYDNFLFVAIVNTLDKRIFFKITKSETKKLDGGNFVQSSALFKRPDLI